MENFKNYELNIEQVKSDMKIKKLSPEVQSTLRTGISISDVTHCISELVQNSLDAEATSIAVRLNLENLTLQVVDNGHGLTKEELDLIGDRYMTSKCHSIKDLKSNLSYYGFRGESLASIRESSAVLMIMSKTKGCEQTYSKVFRAGKESHEAVVSSHNRLCVGTTVVVKDFLHNLPVRRARIQPAIEIEYIRNCLICLSIINYKVSFTLRNDVTKLVILQTQEFSSSEDALNYHCNLKENHRLVTISSNESRFKISAHISRETEPFGSFQFIYVNGRLVKNKRIYKLVIKHLSKSFSMRNIGKEVRGKDDKPKEKSFPVFIIHIQCPFSEYDVVSDPKKVKVEFKRWDFFEKSLENVIDRFVLNENTFYDTGISEPSWKLQQTEESNLDASNTASHNDHVVKSNLLYSKSVSRPNPDFEVSGNICENPDGTNHIELNRCSEAVQDSQKKNIEKEELLKQSNNIVNHDLKSKKFEIGMGQLKPSCQETKIHQYQHESKEKSHSHSQEKLDQKETNSTKRNTSKQRPILESINNMNEIRVRKPKEFSLASTVTEVDKPYNKMETKGRLCNKSILYNSNDSLDTNPIKNCITKAKFESPFLFKAPKTVSRPVKRKHFTEHILTESESDVSPSKKMCSLGLQDNKIVKQSIFSALPSVRTCSLKKNFVSEHILTESESNFSFKAPKPNCRPLKRKYLTEHILTDSESGVSSTEQMITSLSQENNHDQKSILPIISHEFFNDALKNMNETQNVYRTLIENCVKDLPRKTFQVKLSRSLKKVPNSNTLRLTQKNTLKYLGGEKGYVKCSKRIQSTIESKERCSKSLASKSQTHNLRSKVVLPKVSSNNIEISQSKNVNLKSNSVSKECVKLYKPNQNWILFSPAFTTVKTTRSYGAVLEKRKIYNDGSNSKKNNIKPSLQIKRLRTFSVNKGDPVNIQASSSINQLYKLNKYPGKSILKLGQGAVIKEDNNPQAKNEIKATKRHHPGKVKHAETQTDTNIHCDHGNIEFKHNYGSNKYNSQATGYNKDKLSAGQENTLNNGNQMNFNKFAHIGNKNQSLLFGNEPSPPYFFCPSPVLTHFDICQSNVPNNGLNENQENKYFKQFQNCSDAFKNISCMSPNKKVNFSPILTVFNFYPHSPVTYTKKNRCARISSSLKYVKSLKHIPISNDLDSNVIHFPEDHVSDLRSHSQQINYSCASNDPLPNLKESEDLYFQPLKYGDKGEMPVHESKSLESHPIMPQCDNSSNIWQDRKQKNFFSGRFKVAQNSTLEILELCTRSPTQQESNHNFSHIKTKVENKATKGFIFENPAINNDISAVSITRHTNDKTYPSDFLNMENKLDCVEQNPSTFQETNCKLPTNESEKEDPNNTNADATTKCYDIIPKNASDSNHENNVMFENAACRDVHLLPDENELLLFTNEKELIENSIYERTIHNFDQIDKCSTTNWNKEITSSGKVFYINRMTGMSSFTTPKVEDLDSTFVLENRHWFMPKGVSPILNITGDFKNSGTKQLSETEKGVVENIVNANNIELAKVKWKDGSINQNQGTETVVQILSGKDQFGNWPAQSIDFKTSCVFSSESLSNAQVLGQVDKKFIAAILQPNEEVNMFLVLFDQHAVDERIRLESLISGYKKTDGQLERHIVNSTLEINLSEAETMLIKDLTPRISKVGLSLTVQGNKVVVTKVPLCLFNRYAREGENRQWLSNMVTALVKQLLLSVQDGRGVMPSMPPLLSELISTEACRGSVKFGDFLPLDLCRLLISKLATCEVPFQCAHGRPVLAPLIEVKEVENVVEPINLKRLSKRIQSSGETIMAFGTLQQ